MENYQRTHSSEQIFFLKKSCNGRQCHVQEEPTRLFPQMSNYRGSFLDSKKHEGEFGPTLVEDHKPKKSQQWVIIGLL